jgi:GMP synthase-like glutamine amidotransferase
MSRPSASARAHSATDRRGLVLSHGDLGPAGLLGEWLRERGVSYDVCDVSQAPMPSLDGYGFVASLGSEESATNRDLAWVGEEIALMREAVASAMPVLGLCFGGQALSIALGGEVVAARRPQIGWYEVAGEDGELPSGPWFHWHYEQLAVPPGGRALAHSEVGPAAFRHGPHLGLQFHPEVTLEVIASWSRSGAELAKLGLDAGALLAESERQLPRARADAWRLFEAWWEGR